MSSTYGGSDTYPASITIPSDGDKPQAASVNPAFQGLADRTTYIANRVPLVGDGYGYQSVPLVPVYNESDHWVWSNVWEQDDKTSAWEYTLDFPRNYEDASTLTEVVIRVDGYNGHTNWPADKPNLPYIVLIRRNGSDGTLSSPIGTGGTDPSTTPAEYEVPHNLTVACSESLSKEDSYAIQLFGETDGGGVALTGLRIISAWIKVTP